MLGCCFCSGSGQVLGMGVWRIQSENAILTSILALVRIVFCNAFGQVRAADGDEECAEHLMKTPFSLLLWLWRVGFWDAWVLHLQRVKPSAGHGNVENTVRKRHSHFYFGSGEGRLLGSWGAAFAAGQAKCWTWGCGEYHTKTPFSFLLWLW